MPRIYRLYRYALFLFGRFKYLLLLAVEVLFRMHRLYTGDRGPRADAVTSS